MAPRASKGASVGSARQVWAGTKDKTSGGLTKSQLMKNKRGKIVSIKRHALGQKNLKFLRRE